MRKTIALILTIILSLTLISAQGEGLLPSISDVVGVEMPSMVDVLHRYPDSIESLEDGGSEETFFNVTQAEYEAFGNSLGKAGCAMKDYHVEDTTFVAEIEKDGRTFTFQYDSAGETAVLIYPAGTVDPVVKAAEDQYQQANQLNASGDYAGALVLYEMHTGYKDVDSIIENDENISAAAAAVAAAARAAYLAQFEVGKTLNFGRYEQDGNTWNGKEVIEWIVLKNDGDTVTLISKYGLDYQRYNYNQRNYAFWETCSLRKWLNEDFFNAAFNAEEQAQLVESSISNPANPKHRFFTGGNDTVDNVWLLSIDEAESLFASESARACKPTAYAKAEGATLADKVGNVSWWLRSLGDGPYRAAYVGSEGSIYDDVGYLVDSKCVVRPVIVLRLS